MAPPSKLAIATSSVVRLLKEEKSYHKELEQQEARIISLQGQDDDENAEFRMNQERRALEETKAVFPPLHKRIQDYAAQLDKLLSEQEGSNTASADEVSKAKAALSEAKALVT